MQRTASLREDAAVAHGGEAPVMFGDGGTNVGIFTTPSSATAERPAILFLNAGVIHRIGPHRLHVTLARRLAAQGYPGLRVDLSGIGDSPLRSGRSFWEQAVIDTRAAMDAIGERAGARRFVLFGLCAGADNALATALVDERVAGVALVDPFTYPTPRAQLRKVIARARQLESPRRIAGWAVSLAARRVRARVERWMGTATETGPPTSSRVAPPVEVFGANLETLLSRRVNVLLCYSGALEEGYNHEDQLFELLPRLRGRVARRYFPEANHQFTELGARRELVDTVSEWLDACHG